MKRSEDLSGKRFCKIVVIGVAKTLGSKKYWDCICDCGREWMVRGDALISKVKPVKSCGCKPRKDLLGSTIGRLTVLRRSVIDKRKWVCLCSCGNMTEVFGSNLSRIHTTSCGCLHSETTSNRNSTHGMTNTTEFGIWQSMKQRCYDENCEAYKDYGGRGVVVCDRWRNSFEDFFLDVGLRPSSKHSLDRHPNNDGNYEPTNFRWATKRQQAQNRRDNVVVEYNGEKMALAEFASRFDIKGTSIYSHIKKKTLEEILKFYKKI